MKTESLLKRLSRIGFHIQKSGHNYMVMAGRSVGYFTDSKGRAACFKTMRMPDESTEYDPSYVPGRDHYSPGSFLSALGGIA